MLLCQILWKQKEWKKILYFAEKSIKSPILRMKNILYCHQKWSISPILSKIPFSYISDFGRSHPCSTIKITEVTIFMVWLGFFEKNVFLRTSGVRANTSKLISTFSIAKRVNWSYIWWIICPMVHVIGYWIWLNLCQAGYHLKVVRVKVVFS